MEIKSILQRLEISEINKGTSSGINWQTSTGVTFDSFSPVDGQLIAKVENTDFDTYQTIIQTAEAAFLKWKNIPAPKRGDIVRQFGDVLREYKTDLGTLVS